MLNAERLIESQHSIYQTLNSLWRNFKKTPVAKRTPENVKKTLERAQAQMNLFGENHRKLLNLMDQSGATAAQIEVCEKQNHETKVLYRTIQNQANAFISGSVSNTDLMDVDIKESEAQSLMSDDEIEENLKGKNDDIKTKNVEPVKPSNSPGTSTQVADKQKLADKPADKRADNPDDKTVENSADSPDDKNTVEQPAAQQPQSNENLLDFSANNNADWNAILENDDQTEVNSWSSNSANDFQAALQALLMAQTAQMNMTTQQMNMAKLQREEEALRRQQSEERERNRWQTQTYRPSDANTIPEFSGELKDYKLFKDCFRSTVDNSPLPPSAKFALLIKKLKGDAIKEVENIEATDERSYAIAWEILDAVSKID